MKTWILLACGLISAVIASAAPSNSRFSEQLTEAERQSSGLDLLSSDQVAALNALVHREAVVAFDAPAAPATPAPKSFSRRLYPDEFQAAGLNRLTAPQLSRLDGLVGSSLSQPGTTAVLAAAPASSSSGRVPSESGQPPPEIHGMVALTYGFGGGASFREATTDLSYVDPSHHLEVDVGYSDLEAKPPANRVPRLP
jgi:hypothetical protein